LFAKRLLRSCVFPETVMCLKHFTLGDVQKEFHQLWLAMTNRIVVLRVEILSNVPIYAKIFHAWPTFLKYRGQWVPRALVPPPHPVMSTSHPPDQHHWLFFCSTKTTHLYLQVIKTAPRCMIIWDRFLHPCYNASTFTMRWTQHYVILLSLASVKISSPTIFSHCPSQTIWKVMMTVWINHVKMWHI